MNVFIKIEVGLNVLFTEENKRLNYQINYWLQGTTYFPH